MNHTYKCPNCGTEIASGFCHNCGWNVNMKNNFNQSQNYQAPPQNNYTNINGAVPQGQYQYNANMDDGFLGNNRLSQENGTSATIKMKDWFKTLGVAMLLMLIPGFGSIASLIYQIVLCCKATTAPSIKNYLKYNFIVIGVILALTIILAIVIFAILASAAVSYS